MVDFPEIAMLVVGGCILFRSKGYFISSWIQHLEVWLLM